MKNKKYAIYVAMPKHPNFYQNEVSKKIRYKKNHSGRVVVIACKTASITEAKRIVEVELIRLFSANPKDELRRLKGEINLPLSVYWNDLMEERSEPNEKSTMLGYRSSWKYGIEAFWGKLYPKDVSAKMVTKFETWYLKNNPTRVFFNTEKHLGMLFRYLVKQGLLETAPTIRNLDEVIIKKTKKEKVGRVYTEAEISSILEHAFDERTRIGILIYRYMGVRKTEILTLEKSRIDLKNAVATIWSFKNHNWRDVPIPTIVLGPLKEWIASNDSIFLFPAPRDHGKHLKSQVFDKSWTKTKVAAGISNATVKNAARIHDLRHTFATQTAIDNWPPMIACKVLDMSLAEYQRTYVHISEEDIRRMMNLSSTVIG